MANEIQETGTYLQKLFTSEKMVELGQLAIKLFLMVIIGLIVIKMILIITRKSLKKSEADPSVYTFINNAVKVISVVILITMCMGAMGIPMSTMVAVLGAAGAAIALALKDSLANIAGGIMIIINKPFIRDDLIDVGDVSGKVESIDLFLTTLRTYDNKIITIPNGLINTSVLVNHSKESKRRVDCTFSIGYDDDIGKAKEILQNVCEANTVIYKDPPPIIGVANHGDSAVILDLKAWCETDDYWDVKYYLEENVKLAFDEQGIEIPYPKMDVNLKRA